MIRTELRRGSTLFFAALVLVAQLSFAATKAPQWWRIWSEASAALNIPWLILGPLVAAFCGWSALRRLQSRNLQESTDGSYRDPVTVHGLVTICVFTAIPLFAAAIVWSALLLANTPTGPLGWQYIIHAAVAAGLCSSIGILLGQFGGPIWCVPSCAFFIAFLRIAMVSDGSISSHPFNRIFSDGQARYEPSTVNCLLALLELLLVAAGAIALPRLWRRFKMLREKNTYPFSAEQRLRIALATAVVAVAAGGVLLSPPSRSEAQPKADPLCTDTEMEICIWPQNAVRLPQLEHVASRVSYLAHQLNAPVPERVQELGLGFDYSNFVVVNGTPWFLATDLGGVLAMTAGGGARCEDVDTPGAWEYEIATSTASVLLSTLIVEEERPYIGTTAPVDSDLIEAHESDSPEESLAFIKTYLQDAQSQFNESCGAQ